jgi:predicted transcriptional regulator YdeE
VEPNILNRERITLVGLSFFGDPFREKGGWTEENEIGRLWRRFMSYLADPALNLSGGRDIRQCYEVHIQHPETERSGEYEVFTGFAADDPQEVPARMLVKVLPASLYAVFTLHGSQITADWFQLIYRDWLPQSGYTSAHPFSFQLYDERFKGLDRLGESTLDLYIPIEKAVKG